jgi:hypothetical protein
MISKLDSNRQRMSEDGMDQQLVDERLKERAVCEAQHLELRVPHNGFGWIGTRCPQCGFMFFGEWEPEFKDYER